jgi:hypothetical protein
VCRKSSMPSTSPNLCCPTVFALTNTQLSHILASLTGPHNFCLHQPSFLARLHRRYQFQDVRPSVRSGPSLQHGARCVGLKQRQRRRFGIEVLVRATSPGNRRAAESAAVDAAGYDPRPHCMRDPGPSRQREARARDNVWRLRLGGASPFHQLIAVVS